MSSHRERVLESFKALEDALERGDVPAVLACCTHDVTFIGSGDGEEARGRGALDALLISLAGRASGAEFCISWEEIDVQIHGQLASVTAFGTADLKSAARTSTTRYRLTGLLQLERDRWLWRVHHGSEAMAW